MFKFNFSSETEINLLDNLNDTHKNQNEEIFSEHPCKYLSLENLDAEIPSKGLQIAKFGNFKIKYITQTQVQTKISDSRLIDQSESDLLPGKYEGGFKAWECSFDLAQFLILEKCIKQGSSVLELGCGVGLPGIVAYLNGAAVTFQDFNYEVLKLITIPNVILNTFEQDVSKVSDACSFLCGDWKCIAQKYFVQPDSKLYDIIVTSETIYEKTNQKKLLELMKLSLKKSGVIYLASKGHYFGVGGGVKDFEELVEQDNTFDVTTVFETSEGVIRQILKLCFKNLIL